MNKRGIILMAHVSSVQPYVVQLVRRLPSLYHDQ